MHLDQEEAGGVVLESRTHCVDQEEHLEVGVEKLEGKNLDEVLLVGKLEVVWSSQVPAGVMYRCTPHPPYLLPRQDLGNSEPWILQMHRKITDFIMMYLYYIYSKQNETRPL